MSVNPVPVPSPAKDEEDLKPLALPEDALKMSIAVWLRLWGAWLRAHPYISALIGLLLLGSSFVVVFGSICAAKDCQWKHHTTGSNNVMDPEPLGPSRLIVSFLDQSVDVLDVLPPILRTYATRQILQSSGLQLVSFVDEQTLMTARGYIAAHPDVNILVRDFAMSRLPDIEAGDKDVLQTTMAQAAVRFGTDLYQQFSGGSNGSSSSSSSSSSSGNSTDTSSTGADGGGANGKSFSGDGDAGSFNISDPFYIYDYNFEPLGAGSAAGSSSSGRRLQQSSNMSPNDPYYTNGTEWFLKQISADKAWPTTTGTSDVVIAIIDTGIDLQHPDLRNSLWVNIGEIPGNGIDDDKNGFIDDVNGWDFAGACTSRDASGTCQQCAGRSTPTATDTHGTHVAGLVAAMQNNGIGISGTAPGVKLMIIRVSDCMDGTIYSSAVASAFNYALQMGAHVVSCSFGMNYQTGFYPYSPAPWYHQGWISTYTAAIKPLESKGVLVVAAAGNEQIDMDNLLSLGYAYNPCLVQLSNVVCVMSTEAQDQMSSFSNFGTKTVHIGAPGRAIMSTMLNGTYGTLSGTSMSAPIVSGVAGLVLSSLGAVDGNYYQAAQVKSMLLGTGDYAGLKSVSGMRVNANTAVTLAAKTARDASYVVSLAPTAPTKQQLSVMLPGFTMAYYTTPSTTPQPEGLLKLLDRSIYASAASFAAFKYSSNVQVVITSYVSLPIAGVYSIKVSNSAATSSFQLYMNNARMPLNAGVGTVSLLAGGMFSMKLVIVNPTTRLDVLFKLPNSAAFVALGSSSFRTMPATAQTTGSSMGSNTKDSMSASTLPTASATAAGAGSYSQGMPLASAWQLFYNVTTVAVAADLGALQAARQGSGTFQRSAVVADLTLIPKTFASTLFPAATALPDGVVGLATAAISSDAIGTNVSFRVTCKQCSLAFDDFIVLDNWQYSTAPAGLTQQSSCVTLQPNTTYQLTLAFAATDLTHAQLQLTWAACADDGPAPSAGFQPLSSKVTTDLVWAPSQGMTGYINGLQCDVWAGDTTPFVAAPTYKFRLPNCPGQNQTLNSAACSMQFKFTLEAALPGLGSVYPSNKSQPLSARCWTYWSGSFKGPASVGPATGAAAAGATAPPTSSAAMFQSAAWLAGVPIWDSTQMQPGMPPAQRPFFAPTEATNLNGYFQLLAVQWSNVTTDTPLMLLDGTAPLTVDLSSMALPILLGGVRYPLSDPSAHVNGVGFGGHFSAALMADAAEAAGPVQFDLAGMQLQGTAFSPLNGLDGAFSYNRALQKQVHYTQALGYFAAMVPGPAVYTLQINDAAFASTMVTMGNVTIYNAPPFSTRQGSQVSNTIQVFLPHGYVFTNVVVKTFSPDGHTTFDFSIMSPPEAAGPVDSTVWFQPAVSAVGPYFGRFKRKLLGSV